MIAAIHGSNRSDWNFIGENYFRGLNPAWALRPIRRHSNGHNQGDTIIFISLQANYFQNFFLIPPIHVAGTKAPCFCCEGEGGGHDHGVFEGIFPLLFAEIFLEAGGIFPDEITEFFGPSPVGDSALDDRVHMFFPTPHGDGENKSNWGVDNLLLPPSSSRQGLLLLLGADHDHPSGLEVPRAGSLPHQIDQLFEDGLGDGVGLERFDAAPLADGLGSGEFGCGHVRILTARAGEGKGGGLFRVTFRLTQPCDLRLGRGDGPHRPIEPRTKES